MPNPTNSRKRAAIYCRISRDTEQEGLGVARQEEDCRTLAEREGWVVVDVYVDNDMSASTKSRKPRPDYARLLADARAGRIDAILAYSNSRLTRRPAEWLELIELANAGRLRIKTVASGEHDLSTADGRAVALTVAAWDAAEAERTAERVARAHAQLALAGVHNGPRPFGWAFTDDRRLVVDPVEASVVRECVDRVLAGEGFWKIANDLNQRQIKTSKGGEWSTQPLRKMLLRWRNCGVRTHNGKEVGLGQWEALYDRAKHERLVALVTDPARRTSNRGTAPRYLLTSVAYCGACGRHVVGTNEYTYVPESGRPRLYRHAYKCPQAGCMKVHRGMAEVDAVVSGVVVGMLERDGVQLLGGDPVAAARARERIEEIEAKLAIAADQFADDSITGDQMTRITQRLRPQLTAERSRLAAAHPDQALADFAGPGVAAAWERADVETRKAILRVLGVRIVIQPIGSGNGRAFDPASITIEWPGA